MFGAAPLAGWVVVVPDIGAGASVDVAAGAQELQPFEGVAYVVAPNDDPQADPQGVAHGVAHGVAQGV